MKIAHTLFEKVLANNKITKKEFAQYAKIPYNTVAGWKKAKSVPAYAMVILKDMIYRKNLNKNAKEALFHPSIKKEIDIELLPQEQKRIEAAFWGSNYSAQEIIYEVFNNNIKFVEHFNKNVPKELREKVFAQRDGISA